MSFATCLSCMDGRVVLPSTQFIKNAHNVEFVDIITEAGMDGFLARSGPLDGILRKLDISFQKHGSCVAYIVGHSDCSGNSVDDEKHKADIQAAIVRLKLFRSFPAVGGLFIGRDWKAVAVGSLPVLTPVVQKPIVAPIVISPPVAPPLWPKPPAINAPLVQPAALKKAAPVSSTPKVVLVICKSCKEENLPGSTYCDQCGKELR